MTKITILKDHEIENVNGGCVFKPFMIGLGKGLLAGSGTVAVGAAIGDALGFWDVM